MSKSLPSRVIFVEIDSFNNAIDVRNGEGHLKSLFQFRWNSFGIKVLQWLNTLRLWKFGIHLSNADVLQLELDMTFVGESQDLESKDSQINTLLLIPLLNLQHQHAIWSRQLARLQLEKLQSTKRRFECRTDICGFVDLWKVWAIDWRRQKPTRPNSTPE